MSDPSTEDPQKDRVVEQLYSAMCTEAGGFYKQSVTVCTAFLGASIGFYDKLFSGANSCAMWLLFTAWILLIIPIAIFTWMRWSNVESHRFALEYLKTNNEAMQSAAAAIARRGRSWTQFALWAMWIALSCLALAAALNIHSNDYMRAKMTEIEPKQTKKFETKSIDPTTLLSKPTPSEPITGSVEPKGSPALDPPMDTKAK